jgi:hypothetical protein
MVESVMVRVELATAQIPPTAEPEFPETVD